MEGPGGPFMRMVSNDQNLLDPGSVGLEMDSGACKDVNESPYCTVHFILVLSWCKYVSI
jgi:hypothetical protein